MEQNDYLLGYGAGFGGDAGAFGVGASSGQYTGSLGSGVDPSLNNFMDFDSRAVFVNFYGSVFGLWDQKDNFFRAPLANPYDPVNGRRGYGLTDLWNGYGFARNTSAAQAATLGACIGQAVFDGYGGTSDPYHGGVHIALAGDPSLRLHTVLPASAASAAVSGNTITVSWTPSSDSSVSGYNIYYAPTSKGPYALLNTSGQVSGSPYSATRQIAADNFYMVRAVKTETVPSGTSTTTYVNMSEGAVAATAATATPYLQLVSGPSDMAVVADTGDGTPNAASFTVYALGNDGTGSSTSESITYQWLFNNQPLVDDTTHILGSQTSTLLIKGVAISDAGTYRVQLSLGGVNNESARQIDCGCNAASDKRLDLLAVWQHGGRLHIDPQ